MAMNAPGTNPAAEEGASNENQPRISYVKHLSHDEGVPNTGGEGESSGGGVFGWVSKVPGGWWTVGIGIATVIILFMTMRAMSQNSVGGTATYPPASTDTYSGGAGDTYGQNPSAMDSQLSGLLSQEQINYNLLQQLLNQNKPPVQGGPPSGGPPVQGKPPKRPAGPIMPALKGTPNLSNNFWVYNTKNGDTLGGLSSRFWKGSNFDFLVNYRNNKEILQWYGVDITNPNSKLPVGIQLSA